MKYHHKPAFGYVYIQKSFPFELDITFTIKFGSNKVVTDFVLNPLKEIQYDLNFIAQIEFSLEMIMGRFENELNLLSQIKKAEIQ